MSAPFANGNVATAKSVLAALAAWIVAAAIFYVPVWTRAKETIEVEEVREQKGTAC